MDSRAYVKGHDFGYGKMNEFCKINKLKLRNADDVKEYVFDALINAFDCKSSNGVLKFFDSSAIIKIEINWKSILF